jgi:hypothetical protein
MSGKSDFTDDEWTAITEAPLAVTVAMFAAGQHGPISMMKESSAGVHAITRPGDRGAANGLVAEIIPVAEGKQARHDTGHPHGTSIEDMVAGCLARLDPAAAVVAKLPADERDQVAAWLVDIAAAVAKASKGVTDLERETVGKIATIFGATTPTI